MAECSAKRLLQNTYLHPPCTTLHPLAQPKVAKVNALLQQQTAQQNFHPTDVHSHDEKALKRFDFSLLTAPTVTAKAKALKLCLAPRCTQGPRAMTQAGISLLLRLRSLRWSHIQRGPSKWVWGPRRVWPLPTKHTYR